MEVSEFYCPVGIYLFRGMTAEEVTGHDDYSEAHFWDEFIAETPAQYMNALNEQLLQINNGDIKPDESLLPRLQDIGKNVTAIKIKLMEAGNQVWLHIQCATEKSMEEKDVPSLKEYIAEKIDSDDLHYQWGMIETKQGAIGINVNAVDHYSGSCWSPKYEDSIEDNNLLTADEFNEQINQDQSESDESQAMSLQ